MEGYMTIPQLAREAKLSDNTVRRYVKNYGEFFQKKTIENWSQYPIVDSLKVIRRISEISTAGKRRADVVSQLKEEEFIIYEETKATEESGGNGAGQIEFGPESMKLLERIAEALEKIAENNGNERQAPASGSEEVG